MALNVEDAAVDNFDAKQDVAGLRPFYSRMDFVSLVEDDEDYDAPQVFAFQCGDMIMEESPFAAVVNSEVCGNYCHQCWERESDSFKLKRCTRCHLARYCNDSCAKKAWKVHKLECARLADYFKTNGFFPDALIRLITIVLFKAKNGVISAPSESCSPETTRTLHSLCSHTADIDKELNITKKFEHNIREIKSFIGTEVQEFAPELIAETYSRVLTNSISIPDRHGISCGVGLYLGISQFDHSCLPNAIYFCRSSLPKLSVIATGNIRSLKDVRISYVSPMKPTLDRRRELKESYYFVCQCGRCQGVEQDGMSRSLICDREGCKGFVLLGKDWRPMGPCGVCGAVLDQNDQRVKKCEEFMMSVLRAVEAAECANDIESDESASFKKIKSLLNQVRKELFFLNYYRCRMNIFLSSHYLQSKNERDQALPILMELIEAYEFYLGPNSMFLCQTLLAAAQLHIDKSDFGNALNLAKRASKIADIIYPAESKFRNDLEQMTNSCESRLSDEKIIIE